MLTDTYGRILTKYDPDGDVRYAVVWVPGDSRIDWDDAGDHELVTLLSKFGYNDALTIENRNVTINANGETETLTWDGATKDFTVDVDMFQNGAQNMYFRTVNDGSQDVTVLCDADGKAIHAPTLGNYQNVLFTVAENGTKIDTITSGSTISREGVSNACGGDVNVTALEAGKSVFLLVMGTHVQYCNADDTTTTPSVLEMPIQFPLVASSQNGGEYEGYFPSDETHRILKFGNVVLWDGAGSHLYQPVEISDFPFGSIQVSDALRNMQIGDYSLTEVEGGWQFVPALENVNPWD